MAARCWARSPSSCSRPFCCVSGRRDSPVRDDVTATRARLPSERLRWHLLAIAVLGAAALLLAAVGPLLLDRYSVNILVRSFLYGSIAVTVDILWGYTGILSFGQSAFFAIGAYACGLAFTHLELTPLVAAGAFLAGL